MKDVEKLIEQAKTKMNDGDNRGSIALLEIALESADDNPTVWNLLGINYYDLDEDDKALECYQKAISIDPENGAYLYNVGMVYDWKKQYNLALQYYKKALSFYDETSYSYARCMAKYAKVVGYTGDEATAANLLDKAETLGYEKKYADEIRKEIGFSEVYKKTGKKCGRKLINCVKKFNGKVIIFGICGLVILVCVIKVITLQIHKKCEVPGCPAEVSISEDYCISHECANSSCENRAVLEADGRMRYYCKECLEKAEQ